MNATTILFGHIVAFLHFFGCTCGNNSTFTTTLHDNLLSGYRKSVRPQTNYSQPTNIMLTFSLVTIQTVDEISGVMDIMGYFMITWTDERLSWDSGNYDGMMKTQFKSSEIWVPYIVLGTSSGMLIYLHRNDFLITVSNVGMVMWATGDTFNSMCAMDVRKYPMDTQTCEFIFMAWGSSTGEINIMGMSNEVSDGLFTMDNSQWEVQSKRLSFLTLMNIPGVSVEITVKRRLKFSVVNIILPMLFIVLGNAFVFLLPPDSGERVGFSITFLLAISVFMTIVSDNLPDSSSPDIPNISYLVCCLLVVSLLIMICVIYSLRFHLAKEDEFVPILITKFMTCCRKRTQRRVGSTEPILNSRANLSRDIMDGNLTKRKQKDQTNPNPTNMIIDNENERDITWSDFGKTFDKMCFVLFLLMILSASVLYLVSIMA